MSRSLSLAAYLAMRRAGGADWVGTEPVPRQAGPLVWFHCPVPDRLPALRALAGWLRAEGEEVHLLVTVAGPVPPPSEGPGLTVLPAPAELRPAVRAFLDYWRPAALIWMQGDLRPLLLSEAEAAGLPCHLVEAEALRIGIEKGSWLPGMTSALVGLFRTILALDAEAAGRLRRHGADADRIRIVDRMGTTPPAPPCNERDRRDLAETIGPRPVWLASDVPLGEIEVVLFAYRQASRRTHRLLLILTLARAEDQAEVRRRLLLQGLAVADLAEGDEVAETTQVLLAEAGSDPGLWYRLSPLTYMGGSLSGDPAQRSPLGPASLGSVVLHGPETGRHAADYALLTAVRATRQVHSGVDLGNAVEILLQPDRAAVLAHAAWEATSRGAEATAQVMALIRGALAAVEA